MNVMESVLMENMLLEQKVKMDHHTKRKLKYSTQYKLAECSMLGKRRFRFDSFIDLSRERDQHLDTKQKRLFGQWLRIEAPRKKINCHDEE